MDVSLTIAAGLVLTFVAWMAYCRWQDSRNARLDAEVDEYNRQVDDKIRQRSNVETQRKYFTDHVKPVDDEQWRDWN